MSPSICRRLYVAVYILYRRPYVAVVNVAVRMPPSKYRPYICPVPKHNTCRTIIRTVRGILVLFVPALGVLVLGACALQMRISPDRGELPQPTGSMNRNGEEKRNN